MLEVAKGPAADPSESLGKQRTVLLGRVVQVLVERGDLEMVCGLEATHVGTHGFIGERRKPYR